MTPYFNKVRYKAYQIDETADYDDRPPPPPPPGALFSDNFSGDDFVPPWTTAFTGGDAVIARGTGNGNIFTGSGGAWALTADLGTPLDVEVLYVLSCDLMLPQTTLDAVAAFTMGSFSGNLLVLQDTVADAHGSIGFDIDLSDAFPILFDWWNGDDLINPVVGDQWYSLEVDFTLHADLTADAEFFVDGISINTYTPSLYDFTGWLTQIPQVLITNQTDFNGPLINLDNVLLAIP